MTVRSELNTQHYQDLDMTLQKGLTLQLFLALIPLITQNLNQNHHLPTCLK